MPLLLIVVFVVGTLVSWRWAWSQGHDAGWWAGYQEARRQIDSYRRTEGP